MMFRNFVKKCGNFKKPVQNYQIFPTTNCWYLHIALTIIRFCLDLRRNLSVFERTLQFTHYIALFCCKLC